MKCVVTICDAYLFLPNISILARSNQSNISNFVCVLYVSVWWYTLLWCRNGIVNAECTLEHRRIPAKYRSDTVAQLVCGRMACYCGCSRYHVTVTCILLDLLPFLDLLQPGFVLPGHRNSLRYHYMLYYRYFLRPWAGGGCLATVASWTTNENLVLNSDFDKPHGLYSSPRHEFRRKYYGHMWNTIYAIGIVHAFLAGKVIQRHVSVSLANNEHYCRSHAWCIHTGNMRLWHQRRLIEGTCRFENLRCHAWGGTQITRQLVG